MRRHTIYIEGRATRSGHPDQNEPISPVFRAAAQYDLVQTDTCNRHPPTPVDVPFRRPFPTPFSEDRESGRPVSPLPSPSPLPLPPTRPLCKTGFEHLPQPPFRATRPQLRQRERPVSTCLPRRYVYYSPCKPPTQLNGDDRPMPTATAMSEDILINVTRSRPASRWSSSGAGTACRAQHPARPCRQYLPGPCGPRAAGHAKRIHRHRAGTRGIHPYRGPAGEPGRAQPGLPPTPIENCCSKGRPSWSRWSRIPWAPRALGCPRRSAWPAACWSICRMIRISAFPRRSIPRPSARSCANACRR